MSTCDFFNCLFPLGVQNEIQLLSRVFCYSRLVCLLVFWFRDASLVKVGNLILDGIVFVFHLAWCVLKRVQNSQAILALLDGFQELKTKTKSIWFWEPTRVKNLLPILSSFYYAQRIYFPLYSQSTRLRSSVNKSLTNVR